MSNISPTNCSIEKEKLINNSHNQDDEWRRSQISSGHKLINLTKQKRYCLYSEAEFDAKKVYLSADYVLNHFSTAIQTSMNEAIALRVNATITRARKNTSLYQVKKSGITEFITEALFDNWWFKANETNFSRIELRNHIKKILDNEEQLNLYLPILSRKPLSPIKNKGPYPDLAEIHTLIRCAEAAQVINTLSPFKCRINILADGFKYNRACQTPNEIVAAYQQGLLFWIDHLNIGDIVKLINYESWIKDNIPTDEYDKRSALYNYYCQYLTDRYRGFFDPTELDKSLFYISSEDDIGTQLQFTFWSIISSTYYSDLFNLTKEQSFSTKYYGDDIQKLYISYISSSHRSLDKQQFRGEQFASLGYFSAADCKNLFYNMRIQAWEAAIRYVAISLTDRDLNLFRNIAPDGIKLTIHGKKSEIHFISTSRKDVAMTAQHSTGGLALSKNGMKVNFRYRLERESQNENPVMIERLPDTQFYKDKYGPLYLLQKINQPFSYVANENIIVNGKIHSLITRKE